MPGTTKNYAHVMNTSVNQESSMITQDSSSSDQGMKYKAHSVSHHLQVSHNLCATNVYAIYRRLKDGLDCE